MRTSLHVISYICLALCTMAFPGSCSATEYSLGQLALGKPLPGDFSANYTCSSRAEFSGATHCSSNGLAATPANISDILIESSSRKILYAYNKSYESDSFDRVGGRAISQVSDSLGGLAPKRFSLDGSLVAVWGGLNLKKSSLTLRNTLKSRGPSNIGMDC